MSEEKKMEENVNNYKFALDIGTRTVVGVLTSKEGRDLIIEDYEMIEHPDRAMFDGQVHDIDKVSEVVKEIKNRLEERNGIELSSASIAAAGRALRTEKVVIEKTLDFSYEIDQELVDQLEMEAIQIAGEKIKKNIPVLNSLYYCVGYSTVGSVLDGVSVKNPIGHSASKIKFSLVATFLPHNVSDTLYKVVMDAGLNIESMTLEPIAALEVTVPSDLRLLNLAIVDIGAGTSDIALTKGGNIFSYGMVDVAGDEITERLMKEYLLDFETAENLKINLSKEGKQEFVDIVGVEYELETSEILGRISNTLDEIAQKIAGSILEINKEVPEAVFLVGGSSQMATLKSRITRALNIDEQRIDLKSSAKLKNVTYNFDALTSPEFVTPIGIAYMSHFMKQREFLSVLINSRLYRLFNRNNLTISDALVLIGFNSKRLIQTKGKAMSFTLDGEKRMVSGEAGEPSKILLNGKHVDLYSPIKHMDMIEITRPIIGKDAKPLLGDIINFDAYVLKKQKKMPLITKVMVNGIEQNRNYQICEGDDIVISKLRDLDEHVKANEINYDDTVDSYAHVAEEENTYSLAPDSPVTYGVSSSMQEQDNASELAEDLKLEQEPNTEVEAKPEPQMQEEAGLKEELQEEKIEEEAEEKPLKEELNERKPLEEDPAADEEETEMLTYTETEEHYDMEDYKEKQEEAEPKDELEEKGMSDTKEKVEPKKKEEQAELNDRASAFHFLNLFINDKSLKIKLNRDNYYLHDLLRLLNYDVDEFLKKFSINVNGQYIENNCKISDGDRIVFAFK